MLLEAAVSVRGDEIWDADAVLLETGQESAPVDFGLGKGAADAEDHALTVITACGLWFCSASHPLTLPPNRKDPLCTDSGIVFAGPCHSLPHHASGSQKIFAAKPQVRALGTSFASVVSEARAATLGRSWDISPRILLGILHEILICLLKHSWEIFPQ